MKHVAPLSWIAVFAWPALLLVPGLFQAAAAGDLAGGAAAKKKIVFVAGPPSHGYAQHEYYAGCVLLAKCLRDGVPGAEAVVYRGWPKEPGVLDDAATIVIFSDGRGGHLALPHLAELDRLMQKGVGMACIHWSVEIPKGPPADCLRRWIGGYFEQFWSVNPFWKANYTTFPRHPVANGLKPFQIVDEWYFHMRFLDDMKGVTPILTATPPDELHLDENTAYGGNPHVLAHKGLPEHTAWVCQRPDGGRGFGFTGGHSHWNWACDNFRKVVLNGIVWTAGMEVPADGVPSATPTLDELEANQDKPQPPGFDRQAVRKLVESFRQPAAASP